MTRNQLPDGVGKKIVEALKRQAEADITPIGEDNNFVSNDVPLTEIDNSNEFINNEADSFDNLIIEDLPSVSIEEAPLNPIADNLEDSNLSAAQPYVQPNNIQASSNIDVNYTSSASEVSTIMGGVKPKVSQDFMNSQYSAPQSQVNIQRTAKTPLQTIGQIQIPANVATLRNLIAGLPVGVTRQTGAQIIKQTMEAMGIPMNGVLKEAQQVQEELNSSTRECLLRIQEYKSNILQLEQSVQEYQKSVNQINDLVSLFLMTDK